MKSNNRTNKTRRPVSKKAIAPTANLPTPLSSFIGRKHEINKVKQLILSHRLVTLTGAGGSGKTRLALKSAQELAEKFKHSVWFVDLASLSDASLIPDKIVSTLNINRQSKDEALDSLTAYLSNRKTLLILDNCEHLIAACAQITESLLQKSPELHILTTSRELLGIPSEVTWVVPPLTLPNQESSSKSANQKNVLKQVQDSESVQLFVDRAASKDPDLTMTVDNCESIAEICNRLDGMPLAIELAAAQMRSLSVQEIAQRLDQRFRFLTGGSRNAPLRQRTLLAAIDWSYALLTSKEQAMLHRLSIFAGGAPLEAAESICSGGEIETADVLEMISHLVDKSLVTANKSEQGETRYRLLETIREYALEKLAESQEAESIKDRHLDHYLQFAEEAEIKVRGHEYQVWHERLEREIDNLRAALSWALDGQNADGGLRLVASLAPLWWKQGHFREGKAWMEKSLKHRRRASATSVAKALLILGLMLIAKEGKDLERADTVLRESLELYREVGDKQGIADVLNYLGLRAMHAQDIADAKKFLNESLGLRHEIGDGWGIAWTLQNFAPIALQEGDYESAKVYAEETISWFERTGSQHSVARQIADLATIAELEGDLTRAVNLMTESISKLAPYDNLIDIAVHLEELAALEFKRDDPKRAALFYGATQTLRETHRVPLRLDLGRQDSKKILAKVQESLSERDFARYWEKGRAMSLEQVLKFLRQGSDEPTVLIAEGKSNREVAEAEPTAEEKVWFQLTARERDVMRLLAEGLSNLEISQKLFLSEKTVRNYVSHIYRKLQIASRGEAIILARKLVSTSEE